MNTTLKEKGLTACKTANAVLLSQYIVGKVDLLKVDIEGAETAVLEELAGSDKLRLVREIRSSNIITTSIGKSITFQGYFLPLSYTALAINFPAIRRDLLKRTKRSSYSCTLTKGRCAERNKLRNFA